MELLHTCPDFVICIKPVSLDAEHDMPAQLQEALGGNVFPIHRLDKNVGGVMVYARTQKAAAALSRAVQEGAMVKEYVALVHGQPPQTGDWEDFLYKDARKNKVFVVRKKRAGVKEARLTFQTLRRNDDHCLVQIRLYTGRTHQIRVQFSSRQFPLVGDHKYGSRDNATAPFLHSFRITFPYNGQCFSFSHLPEWAK